MSLVFWSYDERPELERRKAHLSEAWPEFMLHGEVSQQHWRLLYERFGSFQFFLLDEDADEVVAEVNSLPVRVDLDALPDRGWDEVLEHGTTSTAEPNAVSAIQVLLARGRQGGGLSRLCLERMRANTAEHSFVDLIAPVRPSLKTLYPLVPMERFVTWTVDDGLPFDPWLRVHATLGAEIVRVCPESMTIAGTIAEWEKWAGMAFPETGSYVVPGALELVAVDREHDVGRYVEPNVWMRHRL